MNKPAVDVALIAVSEKHPPPHQQYLVARDGMFFTATPCYGMHNPWWVVRTMAESWPNEADPVPMKPTDLWRVLISPPDGSGK